MYKSGRPAHLITPDTTGSTALTSSNRTCIPEDSTNLCRLCYSMFLWWRDGVISLSLMAVIIVSTTSGWQQCPCVARCHGEGAAIV